VHFQAELRHLLLRWWYPGRRNGRDKKDT